MIINSFLLGDKMTKEEQIERFAKVLFKIAKNNLVNYKNNIKTLTIEESDFQNRAINNAGSYNERQNKIYLRDLFANDIIYHELFHLASTKNVNDKIYSGFSMENYNVGLNEGYTQLLTERYFPVSQTYTLSYPYEVVIAEQMEMIIGKENMLAMYLNADFKNFIILLENYLELNQIKKLVENLDFIHENLYKNKNINLLKEKIQEVGALLIKAYETKLEINNITNKEEKINYFIKNMDLSMTINNEDYDFYIPSKISKGGKK